MGRGSSVSSVVFPEVRSPVHMSKNVEVCMEQSFSLRFRMQLMRRSFCCTSQYEAGG